MGKTFYDWCVETDNTYLLDLWDYDLNNCLPSDIGAKSNNKYYFKCPRGIHDSEQSLISHLTGCNHKLVCRQCHSFGQWCLDNNHEDLLKRWDYELNDRSQFEVRAQSNKSYYFKCPLGNPNHKSELKVITNIYYQEGSRGCIGCNSFAQYAIDNIDSDFLTKYWSDKNTIDPFTITAFSKKKVWIRCQEVDYHGDYEILASDFSQGTRCPYCSGGHKPHLYDSLGYKFPLSLEKWSTKNKKTPYDYFPNSNKKVWFHCDVHGEYLDTIYNFYNRFGQCPKCIHEKNWSSLQYNVNDYIVNILGYECLHEQYCNLKPINPLTNHHLFYDNEIPELKLIIEVHGSQHYNVDSLRFFDSKHGFNSTEERFKDQNWKDKFKMYYALFNGYYYLEIPYWTIEKHNYEYRDLINNKINEILQINQSVTTAGDIKQLVS